MQHKLLLAAWLLLCLVPLVFTAPPRQPVIEMKEEHHHLDDIAEAAENVAKAIANGKQLSEKDVKPPDHLDAFKIEQDGMLNKDYKKEIFLGEHEEIEHNEIQIAEAKLKDIFEKVDTDKDSKMCREEMSEWILEKTREHFDMAQQENDHIFEHMDPDGDGLVTWKEYYIHFLLAKGYPLPRAKKHVEDYEEIQLDFDSHEQLIRYKFRWTDADTSPVDNNLSKEEFLAFRHPEQSKEAMNAMLDKIIANLDADEDGVISENEFVSLPLGEVEEVEQQNLDKDWQQERRAEFSKHIDSNHDGNVTKEELQKYLDPRNPEHARTDAQNLLDLMDDDKDQCINWDEIINHRDMFIHSKVVNVRRMLHDEF